MFIKGNSLKFITKEIRRLTNERRRKEAKRLKLQLPAIAVSALFPGEREKEQADTHTGYVLVDVDGMKTPVAEYLERSKAFPWLALAYVSARGGGVHLLFRVETDIKHHPKVCQALYDIVETTLGEAVDRVCTDITRTSLICWDESCYYNPEAKVFRTEKTRTVPYEDRTETWTEDERLSRYLDQADSSNSWTKGQRHAQLVSLAFCLNRAGFGQQAVERECVLRYAQPDFDAKEITKTIASVYTKARAEHGKNQYEKPAAPSSKYANAANYANKYPEKGPTPEGQTYEAVNDDFEAPLPTFDKSIADSLPAIMRDMLPPNLKDEEFDMALTSALTMLSTVTPRVHGQYHGRNIAPTLYLYIVARAGSGKGILNTMRPAVGIWQKYIHDISQARVKEFEKKEHTYLLEETKAKRSGKPLTIDPPEPVRQMNLNIPGSITQAKLTEQLATNEHYPALMHESEIGILTDAISQDYGKYTHLLNKIAHQEEIGRDSLANSYQCCQRPLMGVLLSGTFGQFIRFIPSADDGLFSRFLAYTVNKPVEWKDLTDEDDNPATGRYYNEIGLRVLDIGIFLDEHPTFIRYTKAQRDRMNVRFRRLTEKAQLYGDDERQGIVNRLGRSHFCICMTLTALRKAERECTLENLPIQDIDFDIAMKFVLVFHEHILSLGTRLKKNDTCPPASDPNIYERLFAELPTQFRTADLNTLAESLGIPPRTAARRLKIWTEKAIITKLSMGKYVKKEVVDNNV